MDELRNKVHDLKPKIDSGNFRELEKISNVMACSFRVMKARLYSPTGLLYISDSVLSHRSRRDAFKDLLLWTSISHFGISLSLPLLQEFSPRLAKQIWHTQKNCAGKSFLNKA